MVDVGEQITWTLQKYIHVSKEFENTRVGPVYIYVYTRPWVSTFVWALVLQVPNTRTELKKGQAEVHPTRVRKRVSSYHIHLVSTLNIPNWYWVLLKPLCIQTRVIGLM
jgi:hypothetical protein